MYCNVAFRAAMSISWEFGNISKWIIGSKRQLFYVAFLQNCTLIEAYIVFCMMCSVLHCSIGLLQIIFALTQFELTQRRNNSTQFIVLVLNSSYVRFLQLDQVTLISPI